MDAVSLQIGDSKTFKQVKAIPWITDFFNSTQKGVLSVIGKELSMISRARGYDIKKIESSEYPHGINAYHIEVIGIFRTRLETDHGYMENYRAGIF